MYDAAIARRGFLSVFSMAFYYKRCKTFLAESTCTGKANRTCADDYSIKLH
jgi:hypothetical protein